MSTERKPPFTWTDKDRAKLVPGSVVECNGVKVTCTCAPHRGVRIKWAFGFETRGTQYADLSHADPATIEPPKPTLAEALRGLIADSRVHLIARDQIEAILKEYGSRG